MLKYVTSNDGKIRVANKYLLPLGIEVVKHPLDVAEIQSSSIEDISRYKAEQAFKIVGEPLIVNDAEWNFPALNGFPGPYVRYINEWLSPEDFIALMSRHQDKTVIYKEVITYIDKKQTKAFKAEIKGKFLDEIRGEGLPTWCLVSLRQDGKSISECWREGIDPVDAYSVWQDFANWYKNTIQLTS
ncbi:MAG: non-canonical purine NTP pyrophosphatase [Patescibacteria group bacterium]|jgi:XTP/dITP diphosphohydrolase